MMTIGKFITFEGGEGAGKTTQAKLLAEALEKAGVETLMTREPGHVEKLIKPALERGVWVISDRFSDSSLAYQGHARGLGEDRVKAVHEAVMGGFEPDLTILFDMDPVLAQKRVETRGEDLTRFDAESLEFHKTLRAAFLSIAKESAHRVHTVDADGSRGNVQNRILFALTKQFPESSRGGSSRWLSASA